MTIDIDWLRREEQYALRRAASDSRRSLREYLSDLIRLAAHVEMQREPLPEHIAGYCNFRQGCAALCPNYLERKRRGLPL